VADGVYLTPKHGLFDVEKIESFLLAKPHSFRDPVNPTDCAIFVCESDELVTYAREKRITDPEGAMPSVCFVKVRPNCIFVGQRVEHRHIPICRGIVEWILSQYDCRIGDEYGDDWTDRCMNSVDPLYE